MCKRVRVNMRNRRRALGLSMEEAARKAKISYSMWSAVEHGERNPSMEVGRRIARVLRTTLDELFE